MIVIKDICKSYGEKKVLKRISFHISKGERVGIIGLNGAGKTTLLNIISGILQPDSGFKRVNRTENVLEKEDIKREIVYVSGTKSSLWEDLRIKDTYDNCISKAVNEQGVCICGINLRYVSLNCNYKEKDWPHWTIIAGASKDKKTVDIFDNMQHKDANYKYEGITISYKDIDNIKN